MAFGPLYALVERKYGFDELYSWLFAGGARDGGQGLLEGRRPDRDRRPDGERLGARGGLVLRRDAAVADRPVESVRLSMLIGVVILDLTSVPCAEVRLLLLSLAIWVPIARRPAGARRRAATRRRRALQRRIALAGAVLGFLVTHPALHRFQPAQPGHAVRRAAALDPALQHQLPPRRGRHLGAVHPAQQLHHRAGGDRRLDGDREPRRAVQRRVPDHVGPAERRVRRARRGAVLRLLRGDADPDVHHHRRLGRARTASMRRSSSSSTRCSARC